jgi:Right handed beta helix region
MAQTEEAPPRSEEPAEPSKQRPRSLRAGTWGLVAAVVAALVVLIGLLFSAKRAVPTHYEPTTKYVSATGNDSSGNGSAAAPYRTLAKAQSTVQPGATVYVRGGVYAATKVALTTSGTANAPITFASYPGETAVLDGAGASFNWDNIVDVRGQHIVVRGFEIRNGANAAGLAVNGGSDVVLTGNRVHDVDHEGIHVAGANVTVENNEVYNSCLNNRNGALGSGGWPAAVDTGKQSSGQASTNVTFRGNNVHDNWGEGIDTNFLAGGVVDANHSTNNYSCLIYSDDSRDIAITNNYVAVTSSAYNRSDSGSAANGIAVASETGFQRAVNMTINNNTLGGGSATGVVYFDSGWGITTITQGPNMQSFG